MIAASQKRTDQEVDVCAIDIDRPSSGPEPRNMRSRVALATLQLACIFTTTLTASHEQCAAPAALYWASMTAVALRDVDVAVLPLGAVEGHGPHLPVGTDMMLAARVVDDAAAGVGHVAVLPISAYGASFEHGALVGTLPIGDNALNALWDDVVKGVVASGVHTVVLVNAHGGQTPNVEVAVRRARWRHAVVAVSINLQAMFAEEWLRVETRLEVTESERRYGIHGGLIETSVMMFLYPGLVVEKECRDFKPRWTCSDAGLEPHGSAVGYGWRSEDLCSDGALGNASLADARLGETIFNAVSTRIRLILQELANGTRPSLFGGKRRVDDEEGNDYPLLSS